MPGSFDWSKTIFQICTIENRVISFRGTGFICSESNTGISAFHVVDVEKKDSLFACFLSGFQSPITEIHQHPQGFDIAKFKIDFKGGEPLSLMEGDILPGQNIYSWGFPLTEERGGRYIKGYVTRYLNNPFSKYEPSYELSVEIPMGLSGCPLLLAHNGVKVAGVLFGNGRSESIDDQYEEIISSEEKKTYVSKKILSYGLAQRLENLKESLETTPKK
jgi:hypothetical protein